ncbi:MAG: dihydropteroate synthase [Methylobacteriaceae bacterium]|jgi:dihydropteroate synthase|nr:dihydropteroate synthase [Methylobacteriaceae bacterium]
MSETPQTPFSDTRIMGILNVTPDSFSDGGHYAALEFALEHALLMHAEGADIIDVGGESTRPGYREIPAAEETARVVPVIRALAGFVPLPVSVDTYKAAVADAALSAGASIVNDIWGLQRDADMAAVIARHKAGVIVMHNRIETDAETDIVADMLSFFRRSLEIAGRAGVDAGGIVLDPGIGFGKTRTQNISAINAVPVLKEAFGLPVLVGASRKSLIGAITGSPVEERLAGTLAAHMMAVQRGADIIRVHDVKAHKDALKVISAIERGIPK